MEKEKLDFLKEVLSIPTCSRHESLVREYLIAWAEDNDIETRVDSYGNLFMKKGEVAEGEAYPCVVAHMDTVHQDQKRMVYDEEALLNINELTTEVGDILYATYSRASGVPVNTGIGGDDKAGIFICLELIKKFDNIMGAFFIEEEIGCNGSRAAKDDEWLEQCGFFMQFDAPTDDWITGVSYGVKLFNDEFADLLEPIWGDFDMSEPSMGDPFTDIMALKRNYPVCCINYFAGYMDMHTPAEYVVIDYVEKAINLGEATIGALGNEFHEYLYNGEIVY